MIVYENTIIENQHPIGFWGCNKNNKWIRDLAHRGEKRLKIHGHAMQGAGTEVIPRLLHTKHADYISPEFVYPFAWNNLLPMLNARQYKLPDRCLGIHWFGGAQLTKELEIQMVPDAKFDERKNFHRIIKELVKYEQER